MIGRSALRAFWAWYNRHYALHLAFTATLFALQIVHLVWLSTDVVAQRITGDGFFRFNGIARTLILIVDYTEIPALVGTSFIYLNELRKGFSWKNLAFLVFLNSQWLHIFWITDEFVVAELGNGVGSALPVWLAWVAIGIDYLELPVIYDVLRRLVASLRAGGISDSLRQVVE